MELIENDKYYYDPKAAEHPIKFVEQYVCNYVDDWAEKPWVLFDFQKQWLRDVYGWKHRDGKAKDKRRFKEVFLELPKGNGKSPFLTLCGLYELLASGRDAALVISAATDFKQANITFDCAKKIILNSPRLAKMVEEGTIVVNQYSIKYLPTNSEWLIMSGNFEGKAGFWPTFICLDEAWEWQNRKMYDSLTRNAKKRSEPLTFVATNSGSNKESICWELHERAAKVAAGKSKDDTLYPVLYCADEKEDPSDEKLWKRVNPALDLIIGTESIREEWVKAKETPSLEPEFRRLHCGQWVLGGAETWLNMEAYHDCVKPFAIEDVIALPCVLGLDMSLNDDLTALSQVWIGATDLYVKTRFWLPRKTAWRYEDQAGIRYTEWAEKKHIKLIDAETIDPATQQRLANLIIKLAKKYKVKALCYDPAKAANVIALCEAAGILCVPVPQGFKLSQTLMELERRIKDRTIRFQANEVMDFCAQNAQIKRGDMGGIRLVKESAAGKWKGSPALKIDGIQALSTALHQVKLELMNPAKPSIYESRGVFVL